MDDTSSLSGGQRGFLKILEFLMNMDEQPKPTSAWYVTRHTSLSKNFVFMCSCVNQESEGKKSIVCDEFAPEKRNELTTMERCYETNKIDLTNTPVYTVWQLLELK